MTEKKRMTEEKKKRIPLSLNMGGMNTPPSMGSSSERIRQNLTHGRSRTVTVENKRKNYHSLRYSKDDDKNAKLTEQEQQLRWKAVQHALAVEEEKKMYAAEVASRPIVEVQKPVVQEPVVQEPVVELPVTPALTEFIVLPPEEIKKNAPAGKFARNPRRVESPSAPLSSANKQKWYKTAGPNDRSDRGPSMGSKTNRSSSIRPAMASRKPSGFREGGDHDDARPQLGLKKLRKIQGRARDRKAPVISRDKLVVLRPGLTLQELAVSLGQKMQSVSRCLVKLGTKAQADTILDADLMELAAQDMGYTTRMEQSYNPEEAFWSVTPKNPRSRPPIVTIMGHVNHGKTSLLDALRKTDVVSQESGGITQHIGAYQIRLASGKVITFIDTPGHEAFTAMRARGAHLTDIVILVVAADEGINEQTIEAIHHCQAAKVPMIVAINKIDKHGAQPDHVRNALLSHNVVVEKMGGDVQDVEVSALKSLNLDGLEEAILLQAEILELKADPDMRAKGVVLETHMKKGHGVVATLLVQEGTLKKSDSFIVGNTWGKVRLMFDDLGRTMIKALPSQPIEVVGLNQVPQAGDRFVVVKDEAEAKDFVGWKQDQLTKANMLSGRALTLEEILNEQKIKEKSFVIKADTQGALEGLAHELEKVEHAEIKPRIILKGIGSVNEGDALLAQASQATILAFNVDILPEARKIILQKSLHVLQDKVIYQMIQEVRQMLSGLLAPMYEEEFLGYANVIKVFEFKKQAFIGGCIIKEGVLRRGAQLRILRDKKVIFQGVLKTLRHMKDEVKEKGAGHECGVSTDGFTEFKVGDVVECFEKKIVHRSI